MMKILLVDDDPEIILLASMALEKIGGHSVIKSSDSKDAIDTARTNIPDVILMDYMMPGIEGPEIFQKLKITPGLMNVPVIFITGKTKPSEVQSLIDMGAKGVISKPFNPMTLSGKVLNLLNQ